MCFYGSSASLGPRNLTCYLSRTEIKLKLNLRYGAGSFIWGGIQASVAVDGSVIFCLLLLFSSSGKLGQGGVFLIWGGGGGGLTENMLMYYYGILFNHCIPT